MLSMSMSMLNYLVSELIRLSVSIKRVIAFKQLPDRQSFVVRDTEPPTLGKTEPADVVATMRDASFVSYTYSDRQASILSVVNLIICQGHLVTVSGQTGSGKTTLIEGFLEDIGLSSGIVMLQSGVSYAPQKPWLANISIRDNITFGLPYNRERFAAVVHGFGLEADLKALALGDQTLVSPHGLSLSGGQRSRISLAIAVYADADVYIFDDPTAALDAQVGRHVVRRVLGRQGLLKDKTRIVATNMLEAVVEADSVCVVAHRTVSQAGNYRAAFTSNSDPAIREYLVETLGIFHHPQPSAAVEGASLAKTPSDLDAADNNVAMAGHDPPSKEDVKTATETVVEVATDGDIQIEQLDEENALESGGLTLATGEEKVLGAEELQQPGVSGSVYRTWIQAMTVSGLAVSLLLLIAWQLSSLGENYGMELLAASPDRHKPRYLCPIAAWAALQAICMFAFLISLYYLCVLPAARMLHARLASSVLNKRMSFFDLVTSSQITSSFANDIGRLDTTLTNSLVNLLFITPTILISLGIVCAFAPAAAAVIRRSAPCSAARCGTISTCSEGTRTRSSVAWCATLSCTAALVAATSSRPRRWIGTWEAVIGTYHPSSVSTHSLIRFF